MRPLLLAALAFLACTTSAQGKVWDPLFDYTNLRPSDEDRWAELTAGEVTLLKANEVVIDSEKGTVYVLRARLVTGEDPCWRIEAVLLGEDGEPQRIDYEVGLHEPKVSRRVELLSLAPDEVKTWKFLKESTTSLGHAIGMGIDALNKNPDKQVLTQGRADMVEFVAQPKNPHWEMEIWTWDTRPEIPRRYETHVDAVKKVVQRQILVDRYPGEPLRKNRATPRPDGLILYDFVEGDGPLVEADSTVMVNYRLFLLDTSKLHDTWQSKRPENFKVSEAPFRGLAEGLPGMRVGGRRKIVMPYPFAFGEAGNEIAPPKAMVVCDIQVEAIAQ
jgi:peptidylprolyl isomerase